MKENLGTKTSLFEDGFTHQSNLIMKQVRDTGFATKAQLEYLALYNSQREAESRIVFDNKTEKPAKILYDLKQDLTKDGRIMT